MILNLVKDISFFLINHILVYVPSRTVRRYLFWVITGGRIARNSTIGLGVKFLDIRKIRIGENTNIGTGCIIDGRGAGLIIGRCVDVAPQVNIWTLQHDVGSREHRSVSGRVVIDDFCWIGNRAIVLPNSRLCKFSVLGAGSVFKGELAQGDIYIGGPGRTLDKKREINRDFKLPPTRRFR